jgi:hypothetical protein
MTVKLVGADDITATGNEYYNNFILCKFTAVASGNMTEFRVKSAVAGNVKCALYADNAGAPGALITAMNTGHAVAGSGWETLDFTSTPIVLGTVYWLAIDFDTIGAVTYKSSGGVLRYKTATYSTFSFPDPAGTGFSSLTYYDLIAGWGTAGQTYEQTFIDGLGIGEALLKTTSKTLSDGVGIGEALIKSMSRILSDGIGIAESWSGYKAFVQTFSDGIGIAEALVKTVSKTLSDGLGVGEALIKTTQKVFSDGVGVGEALVKRVSKTFTDGIGIGEALTKTISRVFTDGIGIGESLWTVWTHGAIRVMSYIRNLPAVRNLLRLR